MRSILRPEITVDMYASPAEKQRQMVNGMRDALDNGFNVIMFIDSGSTNTMRGLYKAVLEEFPDTLKQLIHVHEPTDCNTFYIERYAATTNLQEIIQWRRAIVGSPRAKT